MLSPTFNKSRKQIPERCRSLPTDTQFSWYNSRTYSFSHSVPYGGAWKSPRADVMSQALFPVLGTHKQFVCLHTLGFRYTGLCQAKSLSLPRHISKYWSGKRQRHISEGWAHSLACSLAKVFSKSTAEGWSQSSLGLSCFTTTRTSGKLRFESSL